MNQPDPLSEWSRIENAETAHALARQAYLSMLSRIPNIDAFVTWLLAGVGATAGLLVANISSVGDALGRGGVRWVLCSLAASIVCGLLARIAVIFFPTEVDYFKTISEGISSILKAHSVKRELIKETAVKSNKPVPEDMTMQQALDELIRPFPKITKLLFKLVMKRMIARKERHGDLHMALRGLRWQLAMCFWQVVFVIVALLSVAINVQT